MIDYDGDVMIWNGESDRVMVTMMMGIAITQTMIRISSMTAAVSACYQLVHPHTQY